MNRLPRLRLAASALLLLTACTGPAASEGHPSGAAPEQSEITVGVLPIADVAPVYLAVERGLFADQGLTVTVELVQGGAAAIPALVSGDLHVSYGNWVSFLLANQEGIDLRAVTAGVAAAPGFTELLALPDSGLEGDPGALAGTTIAVNTLNNIGELAIRSTLLANDVDPADVQLVEVPFPEMGAALERGDVDVIWASEPVPTVVKRDLGAVTVVDSFIGEMDSFPVAGYQATAEFVDANPRTIAAFQQAMAEAVAIIANEPETLTEVLLGYTNLEPDVVAEIALPNYQSLLDLATLERVRDYLVEFDMLETGMDVEALVVAAAPPE